MVDIVNSTRTSKSMPPPVSDILGMRMARRKVLETQDKDPAPYERTPAPDEFIKLKSQIALKISRSPGTIRGTEMPGDSLKSLHQIVNFKTIPPVLDLS